MRWEWYDHELKDATWNVTEYHVKWTIVDTSLWFDPPIPKSNYQVSADLKTLTNLATSYIYLSANCSVDYPTLNAIKCANLVNLSIIIHTASLSFGLHNKAVMKSIVIFSHFYSGIDSDWSNPDGLRCSAFTCWQIKHFDIYLAIFLFIPFHQKCFFKSGYILVLPEWSKLNCELLIRHLVKRLPSAQKLCYWSKMLHMT